MCGLQAGCGGPTDVYAPVAAAAANDDADDGDEGNNKQYAEIKC